MNVLKTAALGVLLAGAAWMPSLANGFDEAASVTSDPQVAYTLWVGMPSADAEAAFDGLVDWTKHEHVQANGGGITVYYTRTLKDGTKQKVMFPRSRTYGAHFIDMSFTTPKADDAYKMYQQGVKTMIQNMGQPKSVTKRGMNYYTDFEQADGYNVRLSFVANEKTFTITRIYVYH